MTVRRAVLVGDVFAVRTPLADELLGRVVSTSAIVGPTHGCKLVYLYRPNSKFLRSDLLVPPLLTSRSPWSRGYFAFVRSEPLLPGDFFERHCFRDERGALYDEESRPLSDAFEPVSAWRLYEDVASIDAVIGDALRQRRE
jgi:hypothetical protein